jgi:hypothetical protein
MPLEQLVDPNPVCKACGVPFVDHFGLQLTCEKLQLSREWIAQHKCSSHSLRDHFAGLAMQGTMDYPYESDEVAAARCYKMADAMMKEREKHV